MKTRHLTLFAIFLATVLLLAGCKKEKTESAANEPQAAIAGMLHFSSAEEFAETQQKVLAMTETERRDWERQQGFKSFATRCEELFEELEAKGIESDDDIYEFVKENSDYFYIRQEEGEEYLTAYLEFSSYYQFVDENRMVQIGNELIKAFDEGIVTTTVENFEKLLNVSSFFEPAEDDFHYYENRIINEHKMIKDNECNCTTSEIVARGTNGNNRTYVRFYIIGACDSYGYGFVQYKMKIRPYKKTMGVWYWCSRTIHYNFDYVVLGPTGQPFGKIYGNYSGSCFDYNFYTIEWYIYNAAYLSLTGYASTPDARCDVSCWPD